MRFPVLSVVADPVHPTPAMSGNAKSSDAGQSGDLFAAMVGLESGDAAVPQANTVTPPVAPADALLISDLFSQVVAEATATDKTETSNDPNADAAGDGTSLQALAEMPAPPAPTQIAAPLAVAALIVAPPVPALQDASAVTSSEANDAAAAAGDALAASRTQARFAGLNDAPSGTGTDALDAKGKASATEAGQSDAVQSEAKSPATDATAVNLAAKLAASQSNAQATSPASATEATSSEPKTTTDAATAQAKSPDGEVAANSAAKPDTATTATLNPALAPAASDAATAPGETKTTEARLSSTRAKANAETDASPTKSHASVAGRAGLADGAASASTGTAATAVSANDAGQATTFSVLHASAQFATAIAANDQLSNLAASGRASSADLVPVAGLAVEIASRASAGNNRFEIRLDPPELGRIDVRLDVDRAGQVTSHLTVERADTLDLLRRDASQLQRALQDAGLKTGDSALQFSLRDQSFANNQQNDGAPRRDAAQILIQTDEAPTAEVAARALGRLLGSSSGLDIRV